jgi:CHAT domain-containing protein
MRAHLQEAQDVFASHEPPEPSLASPPINEAWLLYHPLDEGWVGFAIGHDEVRAEMIETIPDDAGEAWHAANLLQPFAAEIGAADRVHFLPMGATTEIPFHGLPWDDDVLIAAKPVAYALDTGRRSGDEPSVDPPRALIVAEPASRLAGVGRLPRARTEADAIVTALSRGGWDVERLQGDEATYAAVTAQIMRSDWVHYAGHAAARGYAGWDSAFALAGEATLDVKSILALPELPRTVVLSGCETGRSDAAYGAGGIHLAAAFLLAGSEAVVAASREIRDEDALAFAEAFYVPPPAAAGDDVVQRFREAVELFRRRHPDAQAWSDLRVWTP